MSTSLWLGCLYTTKPIVRCFFMTGLTVIPSLTLPLAARVKDPGTSTITAPTTRAESQGG